MEPKGRLGLGRAESTRTSIGMEPILDQQGILQGFTVRAYFQCALHCYSDARRTIVQWFITVLLSFEQPNTKAVPLCARRGPAPNPMFLTVRFEMLAAGMFNAVNFSDNVEMIVSALRATASRCSTTTVTTPVSANKT